MAFKISRTTFAIVCFALLYVFLAPPAHAQTCSPSQVAGKWAFWTQGNVNGIGPRVSAGIFTLDTSGKLPHGKATSSLAGTVAPEIFSGTYSVDPDCSGEIAINVFDPSGTTKLFSATLAIYFDDGGQEVRGIFTSVMATPVVAPPNGAALLSEIVFEGRKIGEQ